MATRIMAVISATPRCRAIAVIGHSSDHLDVTHQLAPAFDLDRHFHGDGSDLVLLNLGNCAQGGWWPGGLPVVAVIHETQVKALHVLDEDPLDWKVSLRCIQYRVIGTSQCPVLNRIADALHLTALDAHGVGPPDTREGDQRRGCKFRAARARLRGAGLHSVAVLPRAAVRCRAQLTGTAELRRATERCG